MAGGKPAGLATLKSKEMWTGYLFILPIVAGYLIFLFGPIVYAFVMSFTNWSLFGNTAYIGLDNYIYAMRDDPVFWDTAVNTVYFSAGLVPLNIVLSLLLAMLLKRKIWGIGLFRTAIFTPVVVSLVVWGIVWKFIFSTDGGLVNLLIRTFGGTEIPWLFSETWTMPTVIVVSALKGVGMNMVIFLAALHDVPKDYYEASKIDGASRWETFKSITLPMITPAVFMVTIITVIGSLKVFGQIYVMTGGGPGTSTYVMVFYIFKQAFRSYEFGYASALAFILFSIILVLTLIQWKLRKRWVHYEQ
ncbi:carbohydrate ABC transporter membrane protein 1, CUT1 family (TC 3.A.1.1.-) [Paenibacillus uliginis N3/975]|uniref:Carbohydrate ABC transporter membrane protein 1, CUT1 family (TC 3.A.1.1.-) n=1 Tax=Paenibacillus uliginis N3/975 TaxID=1313296 RepID=A0A1X7HKA1_9BACL|nr:sugar ABC transporter permease [Paenibacillus uliginis]SMF88272.1 carbohydrate ABC transporter membrane protein 1, CUT1 family (TC 3.A.1.1.-) [Paenibacillus uliginis N3/975]